jgi:hypothetical protein
VTSVPELTGLAVSRDVVVWSAGALSQVYALARNTDAATPRRIAGPLASDSPLVVDRGAHWVSWVSRSPKRKGLPTPYRWVYTARLDSSVLSQKPRVIECDRWPAMFIGDGQQQLCCEVGQPLLVYACPVGKKCVPRRFPVMCPEAMVLAADTLYFAQGAHLLSLERASSRVKVIAKAQRKPRELAVDDQFVYWVEGQEGGELWRVAKAQRDSGPAAPELMARAQDRPNWLAVDGAGLVWAVSEAPGNRGLGAAIVALPLASSRPDGG